MTDTASPLDTHGGATAADLAAWYAAAVGEVTDLCAQGDLRPSQVQLGSWLFGLRSLVVGFPDADTASVDQLAVGGWSLPVDPAPPAGLYQRTGTATVGDSAAVTVSVYCADPNVPPAVFEPAEAQAPIPAPALPPADEGVTLIPSHLLAPPASA